MNDKSDIEDILHHATLEIIARKVVPKDAVVGALDWAIGLAMTTEGSNELGSQIAIERVREVFRRRLHGRAINDQMN